MLSRSKNLLKATYPLFLGGKALTSKHALPVVDKFSSETFAHVSAGDALIANKAFDLAHSSLDAMAALPSYERKRVLLHVASEVHRRRDEVQFAASFTPPLPLTQSAVCLRSHSRGWKDQGFLLLCCCG